MVSAGARNFLKIFPKIFRVWATSSVLASMNEKKSPTQRIEATGARRIFPPRTLGKKYRRTVDETTKPLLVAILHSPAGEHMKDILNDWTLRCVTGGVYAASFYALSPRRVLALTGGSA